MKSKTRGKMTDRKTEGEKKKGTHKVRKRETHTNRVKEKEEPISREREGEREGRDIATSVREIMEKYNQREIVCGCESQTWSEKERERERENR